MNKFQTEHSDVRILNQIADVYVYILKDQETSMEYERVSEMVDTIDRFSQQVWASYALTDLRCQLKVGTTKMTRLSHNDYKILASIRHIKLILSLTTINDYEKDKKLIFKSILKEAENFATIKILSKKSKSALDSCLLSSPIN
ncbi:MAG: hypothetical protein P8I82_02960 [Flavobacteriales bacterium]|nr:hypothetical protein [Flavobacteriales bacterium]